jgi:hypothetical protein
MIYRAICMVAVFVAVNVVAAEGGDIPKNEDATISNCKTFAEGEDIYRRTDWDGDGVLEYAQTLRGGKDGVKVDDSNVDFGKLPPPTEEEGSRIDALLKDLGSEEYAVREKATVELIALGAKAAGRANAEKGKSKDLEVQERCARICAEYIASVAPLVTDTRYGLLRDPEHDPVAMGLRNGVPSVLIDKSLANAECPLGSDPSTITPKAGYLFRVLTRQGKNAPGGSRNYIVKGNMIVGYGLLAFPKEYDKTGRKCFTINNTGTVYERDFGDAEKTTAFVEKCVEFNPDRNWSPSD